MKRFPGRTRDRRIGPKRQGLLECDYGRLPETPFRVRSAGFIMGVNLAFRSV
jgi:hypothetical protein